VASNPDTLQHIERFRRHAATSCLLWAASDEFRELCEHLDLALTTLAGLEARSDAASRALCADYVLMIAELENDLELMIAKTAAASQKAQPDG
jgi:hypothetical protein